LIEKENTMKKVQILFVWMLLPLLFGLATSSTAVAGPDTGSAMLAQPPELKVFRLDLLADSCSTCVGNLAAAVEACQATYDLAFCGGDPECELFIITERAVCMENAVAAYEACSGSCEASPPSCTTSCEQTHADAINSCIANFAPFPMCAGEPECMAVINSLQIDCLAEAEAAFIDCTGACGTNQPPTANAGGPYTGTEGTAIAMSAATASDPDISDALTYSWSVNSASCTFDDASALNPSLTCSDDGDFTVTLEVSDGTESVTSDAAVTVIFNFTGFFQPVDNLPTLNSVKAGQAIPVKFSLGGDQGLSIFMAGYPKSEPIACNSNALVDGIEETVTAGSSSLTYDPGSDQYHYVWKTQKSWANTCRQLVVKFIDGTLQRANFQFK
jgi:hypothetical protein